MKSIPFLAHMRGRTAAGIGLSLLIHALILFFAVDRADLRVTETGESPTAPLTVSLIAQAPSVKVTPSAITPPAEPAKKKEQAAARKKSAPGKKDASARAKAPPLAPKSTATAMLPPDMSDMLAAARERRRAAGILEPDNSVKPASDDNAVARANIAEMMQKQSRGRNESGGVFQITYKGVRTAEFLFRGWDLRRKSNSRQLIIVDAPPNVDIETAIVRRMITLIRQYENGDFQWNSPRLGRVVTLSARAQDSTELEEFMKRDFFEVSR